MRDLSASLEKEAHQGATDGLFKRLRDEDGDKILKFAIDTERDYVMNNVVTNCKMRAMEFEATHPSNRYLIVDIDNDTDVAVLIKVSKPLKSGKSNVTVGVYKQKECYRKYSYQIEPYITKYPEFVPNTPITSPILYYLCPALGLPADTFKTYNVITYKVFSYEEHKKSMRHPLSIYTDGGKL